MSSNDAEIVQKILNKEDYALYLRAKDSFGMEGVTRIIEHLAVLLWRENCDHCEMDTEIRKMASAHLSDIEINGDHWGVPTLEDVVERLCDKIKK